jgi:hypothetical protein
MTKAFARVTGVALLAALLTPLGVAHAQSSALEVRIREVAFRTSGATDVTVSLSGAALGAATLSSSNFTLSEAGKPVAGLTATPRQQSETVPIAVALVVDTSGSIKGAALTQAKAAAKILVSSLPPNSRVALFAAGGDARRATG